MDKKNRKNNVIPFPEDRIHRDIPFKEERFDELTEKTEWLNIEDELWAKEDFETLIRLHLEQLEKYPKDSFVRFSLAQAYFFNYEYGKALKTLHQLHEKFPEDPDVLYFIFEVLILSGKSGNDFDWVIQPEFIDLTEETVNVCYNVLKPGHKPCSIDDLFKLFSDKAYLTFAREHLLSALIKDRRFIVRHPDSAAKARIEAAPE